MSIHFSATLRDLRLKIHDYHPSHRNTSVVSQMPYGNPDYAKNTRKNYKSTILGLKILFYCDIFRYNFSNSNYISYALGRYFHDINIT